MRIAFCSPLANLGGAERLLVDLIGSIRAADPYAEPVLLVGEEGPLVDACRELDVPVELVPMPAALARAGDFALADTPVRGLGRWVLAAPTCVNFLRRFGQTLDRIDPLVVHSNGLKFHFATALTRKDRLVIWHVHEFLGERSMIKPALRWAARRVDGAIAVSNAVADDLHQLLACFPVFVVPNGVDTQAFRPDAAPGGPTFLDALAGMPAAGRRMVRVGLVATFAKWKGHGVFLRAAAKVLGARSRPPVRFSVIGGPVYSTAGSQVAGEDLARQVRRLGIADHVGFVAFRDQMADIYGALDVVVHASTRREPFGLVVAEAMSSGRAVIACRSGGTLELFRDGHDAIGATPGDVTGLAAAIDRLVEDEPLRRRLGQNARRTALQFFDRNRLGPQVLAIYRSLLHHQVKRSSCFQGASDGCRR